MQYTYAVNVMTIILYLGIGAYRKRGQNEFVSVGGTEVFSGCVGGDGRSATEKAAATTNNPDQVVIYQWFPFYFFLTRRSRGGRKSRPGNCGTTTNHSIKTLSSRKNLQRGTYLYAVHKKRIPL